MPIIKNDLVAYFDTNNTQSLIKDLNSDFTLKSLVKWTKSITSDVTLKDYGLTAYDIGQTNSLTSTTSVSLTENKLTLYPINSNDFSGSTQSYLYPYTTSVTNNNITYLNLTGGYFQNYFKLEGYEYNLLPYRYNKGLTIETWININNNTTSTTEDNSGIILYLGTRSENKFSPPYSGDSGYSTSNGISLSIDNNEIIDYERGVKDNVFCFLINKDLQIGYKYIDDTGKIIENYSEKKLELGWNHIAIIFKPNISYSYKVKGVEDGRFDITWEELIDCLDKRKGNLTIMNNGLICFEDNAFPEQFWFKGLETEKEKQIGVPYNIVWGGGSFGLKNSYHYSQNTDYEQDPNKQNLLIENNFKGGFFGGISVLRVYERPLTVFEIRFNFNQEASNFGLNPFNGGRIIYT